MQRIIEKIKEYDVICIYRHQAPDGDALGSQFGLAQTIKANFPNKSVYTFGDHFVGLENVFPHSNPASDEVIKTGLAIILDTANSERIDNDS